MARHISKSDAIDKLWHKSLLHWKLDSCQKQLYHLYIDAKYRKVVWNCSRRLGKSFTLLIIATEYALKNENAQIKYACPTALMAQKLILPSMREILKDCPSDIKPEFVKSEKTWYFKNGSIIQIEGTDEGNAEKLRGTASHLSILDEAGFMDDLDYVINDILLPQCLTTNGKLIISSTPPKSPNHPYKKFVMEAQKHNTYIKKSIMDAMQDVQNDPPFLRNRLNPEIVEELKISVGGENSSTWRREFMCELVTDTSKAVIPEFSDKIEAEVVKEWPRPVKFDAYTAMDLGFIDFTGILFAYYDFQNAKVVIEDEILLNGHDVTTKTIAKDVFEKENDLWTDPKTQFTKDVYLRISDDDLITLNDLRSLHGITFIPTKKDNLEASINEVRMKIGNGDIIINPRCKNLIFQLKTATWTKNRKTFERTEEAGHYDLVAALIYLIRNIQYHKNPYPLLHNVPYEIFSKGEQLLTGTAETVKRMFKLNK